jgi:hypothetical protein
LVTAIIVYLFAVFDGCCFPQALLVEVLIKRKWQGCSPFENNNQMKSGNSDCDSC